MACSPESKVVRSPNNAAGTHGIERPRAPAQASKIKDTREPDMLVSATCAHQPGHGDEPNRAAATR